MPPEPNKISELERRLDSLVRRQIDFQLEITAIRKELTRLRNSAPRDLSGSEVVQEFVVAPTEATNADIADRVVEPNAAVFETSRLESGAGATPPPERPLPTSPFSLDTSVFAAQATKARTDLERFIGENLISKIGIVILILGVGIGAKYAIDNDLIDPSTRILLGYAFTAGLAALSLVLRRKYAAFSAVLLSGAFAMAYFLTFFAYAAYGLIGRMPAFGLMAALTLATVGSAIAYNRQIIAHIGLVGGYAVPFLLNDNSGNYLALFIYVSIVNCGILGISILKAWKPIFITASVFTWLIFGGWLVASYKGEPSFGPALIFLGIFFAIFYAAKVIHGHVYADSGAGDILAVIITALIFYACLLVIGSRPLSTPLLTVYFGFLCAAGLAILITSFRFYGRVLIYVACPCSWLIFGVWFFRWYVPDRHLHLAVVAALSIFFIFYATTLIYALVTESLGVMENRVLVLSNSFVFYGFGYQILNRAEYLYPYQGAFTAANALFHGLIAQFVIRVRPAAAGLRQCLVILLVTFVTVAVPVQFNGHYITLIWSVEATALLLAGRAFRAAMSEYLSYPVFVLAVIGLFADWGMVYSDRDLGAAPSSPFANGEFLTGMVAVASFAAAYYFGRRLESVSVLGESSQQLFRHALAAVGLLILLNVLRMEIGGFFYQQEFLFAHPSTDLDVLTREGSLSLFNVTAQIDLCLIFLIALGTANLARIRSVKLGASTAIAAMTALGAFALAGDFMLSELSRLHAKGDTASIFGIAAAAIVIRYLSYVLVIGALVTLYAYVRSELLDPVSGRAWRSLIYDATIFGTLLIVASFELLDISREMNIADADKYGLSILWGMIAFAAVALGIASLRKHLRIGAIVLLTITLLKLFGYDSTDLPTIQKTILFVVLGILLLLISFLYTKYKDLLFPPDETISNGDR